jgi:hypothetical protein
MNGMVAIDMKVMHQLHIGIYPHPSVDLQYQSMYVVAATLHIKKALPLRVNEYVQMMLAAMETSVVGGPTRCDWHGYSWQL